MGAGDDVMSTAYVKALSRHQKGCKFVFGDANSQYMHWSDVFLNNPLVLQPGETYTGDLLWIPDFPGNRQYIDYAASQPGRFAYRSDFIAPRGDLHFDEKEKETIKAKREELGRFVVIEPNVKGTVSADNKDWGFKKWRQVSDAVKGDIHLIQVGPPSKGHILPGMKKIPTESFRQAMVLLAASEGFIGTDGGLHHVAGALHKKAVVVWGGYSSPKHLGYDDHLNVMAPEPDSETPCGNLSACEHCRRVMDSISIETVESAVRHEFDA